MGTGALSGFDFDTPIDRSGSHSEKYDLRRQLFGSDAVEPLWVADMDFAAPPAVQQALAARVAHPVYGYTLVPDSVPVALSSWLARRHGWQVDLSSICLAPGMVSTLYAAVAAFTQPGEGVVVQPPVYPPLFDAVSRQGRVVLENPLRQTRTGHAMDLERFEALARGGARLLLLCSPHNPVGRVWRRGELQAVLDIARRYGVAILSDEIHADLVYAERHGAAVGSPTHIPLGCLATADDTVITAVAPSKTFNIPGLGLSATIASNQMAAQRLADAFGKLPVSVANPLGLAAFEAAYTRGDAWLDACLAVLRANRDALFEALGPADGARINGHPPEATYLAWLDCRAFGLSDADLMRRWVEAGLGLSAGARFGTGGSGFMRLNFAIAPVRMAASVQRVAALSQR